MKKATIWFLTIIMALTFGGLLYIQVMYMNDMIRMRDDQFVEGVRRSLYKAFPPRGSKMRPAISLKKMPPR